MLKDIDNLEGVFVRQLVPYFDEYYLDFSNFEDIKELIDSWGLLYQGEPKIDNRQVLDYMTRRKEKNKERAERVLIKSGRINLRSNYFEELKNRRVKDMSRDVKIVAGIIYRSGLCEVVI